MTACVSICSAVGVLTATATPAIAASGDHFTCRASALRVEGLPSLSAADAEPAIANSRSDRCESQHTATASIPAGLAPVVSTNSGALSATTRSTFATASGQADVADVSALEQSLGLRVGAARSLAAYVCRNGSPSASSSSDVVDLRIGSGSPVTSSKPVSLPGGGVADVELNRTIKTDTSVTQRAVNITVLSGAYGGVEIVLGEATAGRSGNPCQTGTSGLKAPVITQAPPASTPSTSATITYKSTRKSAGLQCSVDGSAYKLCDGTTTLDDLASGTHEFAVRETEDGVVGPAATTSWTVTTAAAPVSTSPPQVSGADTAGSRLSCSQGEWKNHPTSFSYTWNRDGTPIQGAYRRSYKLTRYDEGQSVSCTVTASKPASSTSSSGSSASSPNLKPAVRASATSNSVRVAVPAVPGCPAATGSLSRRALGGVALGMTHSGANQAFPRSSTRKTQFEQFFCMTPIGVRVGYASTKLLRTLSARLRREFRGRVVWASTSNPHYAFDGIRAGATLARAKRHLGQGGNTFAVGLNDWYIVHKNGATLVLKVRHGIVEEVGIADSRLTRTQAAEAKFITSFY